MDQEQSYKRSQPIPDDENDVGAWIDYFEGLTPRELVLHMYAAAKAATMDGQYEALGLTLTVLRTYLLRGEHPGQESAALARSPKPPRS